MLIGEIDYTDTFLTPAVDDDPNTLHFHGITIVLLFVFILVVPILLINLLIGLAVGEIAEIRENAVMKKLEMQVKHKISFHVACLFIVLDL